MKKRGTASYSSVDHDLTNHSTLIKYYVVYSFMAVALNKEKDSEENI